MEDTSDSDANTYLEIAVSTAAEAAEKRASIQAAQAEAKRRQQPELKRKEQEKAREKALLAHAVEAVRRETALALDALKRAGLHPRTLEIDDFRYNKYVGYGWYIKVWGGVIIGGGESASSEWRGSIYGGDDGYRSESASLGSYEPKCGFILTAAGIIMAFVEPNPVALNYRPIAAALPDNGIYNCRPASDKELVQGIPQFLYSTDGNTDLEKAPIRWRKFFIDLIKTAAASQAGN